MNFEPIADFDELQKFLSDNYISTGSLRFNYSKECLEWSLKPPGYHPELLINYRLDGKLVGTISGVPITIKNQPTISINFLCVHPEHRSIQISHLLTKELNKRAREIGYRHSIFTRGGPAGKKMSRKYYHYLIDPEYLVEVGLLPKAYLRVHESKFDLETDLTNDFRPVTKADIPEIHKRLVFSKPYSPTFTLEELEHYILPRQGVVHSFVKDDYSAFTSYFIIDSSFGNRPIKGAYELYSYSERGERGESERSEQSERLLISAKQEGCHQFSTLYPEDVDKLQPGTGALVYFYDQEVIDPGEVEIVMV